MADGYFPCREEEPLFKAIRVGDVGAVRTLLMVPGTNLMLPSKPGWLAIHEAAWYGQDTCLTVLLSGRHTHTHTHTHTHRHHRDITVSLFLISAQPGIINKRTAHGETALLLAVSSVQLRCIQVLLERGADTNISSYDRDTPLYKGTTDRK